MLTGHEPVVALKLQKLFRQTLCHHKKDWVANILAYGQLLLLCKVLDKWFLGSSLTIRKGGPESSCCLLW